MTWFKHRQEVDSVPDEQKLARTLAIIRSSTPQDRKVLKVLFYGQSITGSGWDKIVLKHWQEKYPDVVFVTQNRALGGFPSQDLVRTTEQDIAAFYPDLIVFHVYGNHRAYEKILRMFRSETAADVILQTDHGDVMPDPVCTEGLQLTFRRQPGCSGLFWMRQRQWNDEMSYHKIPAFAKKYGMAVEPQRIWWREYLLQEHVDPQSLLRDNIHPNERGKELIARFFNQYFDNLVDNWAGETGKNVVSFPPSAAKYADGAESLPFDGGRLELITRKPVATWPSVTIDGVPAKDSDGCYQVTRSTPLSSVPDWPAVRRITLHHDHTPADWTAAVTKISADQKSFDFTVKGSSTGDEGRGMSGREFVSRSGQVSIDADDWMFERGYDLSRVQLQAPFEVRWSIQYVCGGIPETAYLGNGKTEYRYVLATGLPNGSHSMKLSAAQGDLADAVEFRAYMPPLRRN